ncbi:MAG TPA: hypothetical protein VNO33_10165, partial [Kofleriaceae bacterium]|nr:hypothetical protein [Kofleriaceae bacterium]
AIALIAACGGDDGGNDGGDGGGDGGDDGGDGGDDGGVDCGFEGEDYLPYAVGHTWTYRLTDLDDGERATKDQVIEPEMNHPDYGPVVVQVTGKLNGETISLARKEGDRVLRFQQEDRDATGALERTTIYEPPQIRIDESSEHLEVGAEWDEAYTEIVLDPDGVELMRLDTLDHMEILGIDDPCDSPMGEFSCLRVRRTRLEGGVAEKEFHFARGIGKIREVGSNQLEELTACAPLGE